MNDLWRMAGTEDDFSEVESWDPDDTTDPIAESLPEWEAEVNDVLEEHLDDQVKPTDSTQEWLDEPFKEASFSGRNAERVARIASRATVGEPDAILAARRVAASGVFEEVDGVTIEPHEASAMVTVYDSVSPGLRDRLIGVPTAKTKAALLHAARARRQAGAPTIKGPDEALRNAPKAEQDAYWSFVGQGAADSDSGWYVPLDFLSWRRSYWREEANEPTYGTGLPPMASSRRQATNPGDPVSREPLPLGQYEEGEYEPGRFVRQPDGTYLDSQSKESSRRQADVGGSKSGGATCADCGAAIERDPEGEEPRTWHHNDGSSHDHEAKPSNTEDAKTAGRRTAQSETGQATVGDTVRWLQNGALYYVSNSSNGGMLLGLTLAHEDGMPIDPAMGSGYWVSPNEVEVVIPRDQHPWWRPEDGNRMASRRTTAVSLTNVNIAEPGVGRGTDASGNEVRFRLSEQDEADLKFVLLGDLAQNFTGVDVDEADIIKAATRTAATARSLSEIAAEIRADWANVYFGAVPYLDAMGQLSSIDDMYGMDDASSIVTYFLSNATSWRGDTARRIKAELKSLTGR